MKTYSDYKILRETKEHVNFSKTKQIKKLYRHVRCVCKYKMQQGYYTFTAFPIHFW